MKVKIFTQCGVGKYFPEIGDLEGEINFWLERNPRDLKAYKITQSQGAIGYSNVDDRYEKNQIVVCLWYE